MSSATNTSLASEEASDNAQVVQVFEFQVSQRSPSIDTRKHHYSNSLVSRGHYVSCNLRDIGWCMTLKKYFIISLEKTMMTCILLRRFEKVFWFEREACFKISVHKP